MRSAPAVDGHVSNTGDLQISIQHRQILRIFHIEFTDKRVCIWSISSALFPREALLASSMLRPSRDLVESTDSHQAGSLLNRLTWIP